MRFATGRPRSLGVALLVVLAAAGCSGGVESLSMADPPATTVPPPAPPDSLPPGLASVAETPVDGVTTTTAPVIGPGSASVNGTVTGPGGPVPGATVEVDRFVGSSYASARTTTAADGTWSFRNILGGDYRIRAWQPPTLDMDTPQIVYLTAGQPRSVALQLKSYQGQQVQVAINPSDPVIDQPTSLVVQVTNPQVNPDGILTSPPVVGTPVTLVQGNAWQVQGANPVATDVTGQATFQLQCTAVGSDPLSAQVANNPPVSLQMPPCGAPPPTTTTTTTLPGGATSTTSTTCVAPPPPPGETTTTLNFGQQC